MKTRLVFLLAALLVLLGNPSAVFAQGTAFTYQGRLTTGTNAANGTYDLTFTLFTALSGGVTVGTSNVVNDLAITNGFFTITLDPGAGVFTGAARWLQVAVRPGASAGAYTNVVPRQPITATPYAIYAAGASAAGLSGTLPAASLSGTYDSAVNFNNAANLFSGNGAGLTNLNASRLASGTLADARLSTNVALRSGGNTFTGNQLFNIGNVGIGTLTPGAKLDVAGSSIRLLGPGGDGTRLALDFATYDPAIFGTNTPSVRIQATDDNYSGDLDLLTKTPGAATNALVSRLHIASATGNVGIGTKNPQSALHVAGTVTADNFLASAAGVEPPSGVTPILAMIWIKPATFILGSPSNEVGRFSAEGPQTVVTITKGFWIGHHEVTQGEYQTVMSTNPSSFTGDLNLPVETVSWNAATNYCRLLTLSERTAGRLAVGWGYRLPTEAEWEYACRAWTTTRFSYGDDLSDASLTNYAWYSVTAATRRIRWHRSWQTRGGWWICTGMWLNGVRTGLSLTPAGV